MGCRNGEAETAVELPVAASGNTLLLATVSTVGLPVEVQVKDGSLYSGVFHTASVDEGYGIVLKKAMMIKKGKCNSVLEVGALVDTLVVLSNDLVQVIVKDFLLPMEGDICHSVGDRLCDSIDSPVTDARSGSFGDNEEKKCINFSGDADINNTHNVKRLAKSLDNNHHDLVGRDGCVCREEVEDQSHRPLVSVPERQVGANEAHAPENSGNNVEIDSSTNIVATEDHYSSSHFECCQHTIPIIECHDDLAFKRSISEDKRCTSWLKSTPDILAETPSSNGQSSNISTSSSSVSGDNNSSCSNIPASPNLPATEGNPLHSTCTKEFTLNPEAKLFFPSFVSSRPSSAIVPNIMNTSYASSIPPAMPVAAAQSSFEISSFPSCAPLPAKFVQYSPLVSGQTGINAQYPRPISGPVNARHQQARFFGQYHPAVQTGTTYVHQHAQPVMVGRAGQLICMHPISQDPMQGTALLPQGFPVMTPCQTSIPKFEGAPAQALQFYMNPHLIAAAPVQAYAVPNPVQFSLPIPAIRPIAVPGGKDFFGTKFQ